MKLTTIASGSTGNAYILECMGERLLLECGIAFRRIQQALSHDLTGINACLLTHEHGDHAKSSADVMKYGIDLYASSGTLEALSLSSPRAIQTKTGEARQIGGFKVMPFSTEHDAAEPVGWLIRHEKAAETLLFATDTYYLRYNPSGVDYFLIECNYCLGILAQNIEAGRVPRHLKERIIKSHFEMSNVAEFFRKQAEIPSAVVLCHLSDSNSNEQEMLDTVSKAMHCLCPVSIAEPGHTTQLNKTPF